MKKMLVFHFLIIFLFICMNSHAFELDKEVKIESGLITGIQGRDPSIMIFKGIPYTAPPVGEFSWIAQRISNPQIVPK